MTDPTALLIATFATLAIGYLVGRVAEARAAHRLVLGKHLDQLGEALHEVMATSTVLNKRVRAGQSWQQWQEKGLSAAEELKGLRRRLRYPLWGLDEPLNWMTRLPAWVAHVREDQMGAKDLLTAADDLRSSLDLALRRSYLRGRPPTRIDRLRVNRRLQKAERVRKQLMLASNSETE